jgi:hypothetical protein
MNERKEEKSQLFGTVCFELIFLPLMQSFPQNNKKKIATLCKN